MLENNRANKYEQPYSGPYRRTQVNTNGNVHLKINVDTDTVNIGPKNDTRTEKRYVIMNTMQVLLPYYNCTNQSLFNS
jgi:hypothetical protein